jgi:hypothetical protein
MAPAKQVSLSAAPASWSPAGAAARGIGGTREYKVGWASYDANICAELTDAGSPVPGFWDSKYIAKTIGCVGADAGCGNPATMYVRQCERRLEVVGIDH